MKSLLSLFLIVFSVGSFANTISFQCKSVDNPGFHKFDAHGVISIDDLNNVEGIAIVSTQKADAIESLQTFEDVKVKGYIRHFRAGEVTREAFDQVVLSTNTPYLKTLNLLIDFEDKSSSRIISIDNFSYRSNCKTIQNYN
ncbi:MAG: hypothetical protein HOP07_16425 [Bacteriovoracaceae bacterium]|nr:hypothetical protein [Bacteriovoracaceae bacterium]